MSIMGKSKDTSKSNSSKKSKEKPNKSSKSTGSKGSNASKKSTKSTSTNSSFTSPNSIKQKVKSHKIVPKSNIKGSTSNSSKRQKELKEVEKSSNSNRKSGKQPAKVANLTDSYVRPIPNNIEKQSSQVNKTVKVKDDNATNNLENFEGKFTLESKIRDKERTSVKEDRFTLKIVTKDAKTTKDQGSVFTIEKIKKDDSALNLLTQAIRDDTEGVKRGETEMFVPGTGEIRSTQPDSHSDLDADSKPDSDSD